MTRRDWLRLLPAVVAARSVKSAPAGFEKIDSHLHIHRVAPALYTMFEQTNWRCVSVCVSEPMAPDEKFDIEDLLNKTAEAARASKGRMSWASTFDARGFDSSDFAGRATSSLKRSFDNGAIAVKIWKNVGMGIKSKTGEWVLPDNKAFIPVFETIQKAGKTLIAHLGEPDGAWQPIDSNNHEMGYYKSHPEWSMLNKPGAPSKDAILAARDRILARHPKLTVVGCHLGSDEEHLDRLAQRLDKYPNFAVDMAARVRYFVRGDHEAAKQFIVKYQDRLLYATDMTYEEKQEDAKAAAGLQRTWENDWKFFATTDKIESRGGGSSTGLGLPDPVLRKIFHDNALRWIPGLKRA